tara:strand:+ start:2725 stop:3735 length:1011 start_codon:yes stop_codon:yes gene_type:complete
MKAHRIYGVKNKEPFCHFPKGDNVMPEVKLQCYVKKKMKSFHGKKFQCIGLKKWRFYIGDIECYIEEIKPFKFKVNDKENAIFKDNQLAGMFYMNRLVSNDVTDDKLYMEYVNDEITRVQDCKTPPYRVADTILMRLLRQPSFKSPVTKQSARNREIIEVLLSKQYTLHRHEIQARNQILIMNCNSWSNRFGRDYVLKNYILSISFFDKLFEFVNQYFFASTLSRLASWRFALGEMPKKSKTKVCILVEVNRDKLAHQTDIKPIIRNFQNDIIYILADLLSCKDPKRMAKHIFGFKLQEPSGLMKHKVQDILPKEYKKLYSKTLPKEKLPDIFFMT